MRLYDGSLDGVGLREERCFHDINGKMFLVHLTGARGGSPCREMNEARDVAVVVVWWCVCVCFWCQAGGHTVQQMAVRVVRLRGRTAALTVSTAAPPTA